MFSHGQHRSFSFSSPPPPPLSGEQPSAPLWPVYHPRPFQASASRPRSPSRATFSLFAPVSSASALALSPGPHADHVPSRSGSCASSAPRDVDRSCRPGARPLEQRGAFVFTGPGLAGLPAHLRPAALRARSGISASVGPSSLSSERSALIGPSGWVTFAEENSLRPFPADLDNILLWLSSVTGPPSFAIVPSTAKAYFDVVGRAHMDRFLPFLGPLEVRAVQQLITGLTNESASLDYLPLVRSPKFLVTPPLVLRFHSVFPLAGSSHDDRVFLAASSFLSLRGRRGGETWAKRAAKILRWKHLQFREDGVLFSVWTKTGWFPLFYPALPSCPLCPLLLFRELRRLSPFPTGPDDPIFLILAPASRASSSPSVRPIRRPFMMSRTLSALSTLGVPYHGGLGSKSWRAGLASSSVLVGLPEAVTKQLGVWKSSAYLRYVELPDSNISTALHSIIDVGPAAGTSSASFSESSSPPPTTIASPPSSSAAVPVPVSSDSDADSCSSGSESAPDSAPSPSILRAIARSRPARRSGALAARVPRGRPASSRSALSFSVPGSNPPSRSSARIRALPPRKRDVGSDFLEDFLLAAGERS